MTEAGRELHYDYKPALLGSAWEFRLKTDGLEWRFGRHTGHVPYDRIARIRLSFRPVTMQTYRFLAEIWPLDGPKLQIASTSWRSMIEQERKSAAYAAFVVELHRRIWAAGGRAAFVAGSPPILYWTGLVLFAALLLALAALTARAVQVEAWGGAAVVGGLLLLFVWQMGGFFRRNRPGTYRPDMLPPALLPRNGV
jgi:hypothetical protein